MTNNTTIPTIGTSYLWDGDLKFTILDINENPSAAFAGNRISAFLTIQWADDRKPSTMILHSFNTYIRQGLVTPA